LEVFYSTGMRRMELAGLKPPPRSRLSWPTKRPRKTPPTAMLKPAL
jgi:hypothetical protein